MLTSSGQCWSLEGRDLQVSSCRILHGCFSYLCHHPQVFRIKVPLVEE